MNHIKGFRDVHIGEWDKEYLLPLVRKYGNAVPFEDGPHNPELWCGRFHRLIYDAPTKEWLDAGFSIEWYTKQWLRTFKHYLTKE